MAFRKNITTPRHRQRGELVPSWFYVWTPHPPSDYLTRPKRTVGNKTYYALDDTEHYECTKFEQILDVNNLPQNWCNPVFHERFVSNGVETSPDTGEHTTSGNHYLHTQYSALNILRELFPVPPSELIDDYAVKAELQFVKATDAQSSLINFIIELIQCLDGNLKIVEQLIAIWKKMIEQFKTAYQRFLKSGHSEAASYWLAWNFAIKPTISDIKNLLTGLRSAQRRLEFLRKRNHKPTTLSFRRRNFWDPGLQIRLPGPELPGIHALEYIDGVPHIRKRTHRIVLEKLMYQVTFVIKAKVQFDIDDSYLEGGVGLGIVWSAMQGLYNPEKILWEASPFSWLADYFVSARQKLLHELFDLSPLKDATILQSLHSFKFKSRWKLIQVIDEDSLFNLSTQEYVYNTYHESVLDIVEYDLYKRVPGFPNVEEHPLRIPGWYQLSNLLALALQLLRRK